MDERVRFVARFLDDEQMTALCAEFGISRKTDYKIFDPYKDGVHGLRIRLPKRETKGLANVFAGQIRVRVEDLALGVAFGDESDNRRDRDPQAANASHPPICSGLTVIRVNAIARPSRGAAHGKSAPSAIRLQQRATVNLVGMTGFEPATP